MCCWHHLLSKQNDPECCDNDAICACVVAAVYHQALIGNVYGNALQRSWSRTCQASFDRDKVIFKMLHQTLAKSSVQLSVSQSVSALHGPLVQYSPRLSASTRLACIFRMHHAFCCVCWLYIRVWQHVVERWEAVFSASRTWPSMSFYSTTSSLSQFAFHSVFTLFWQAVCVNEGISMYYLFQSLR